MPVISKNGLMMSSCSRQIVSTRNYIIHGYDSLDNEILWGIVINHLPRLKVEVSELLAEPNDKN